MCATFFAMLIGLTFLKVIRIVLYCIFALFLLATIFVKPMFSIIKAGFFFHLITLFISIPLGIYLINTKQNTISTHFLTVILSAVNICFQAASIAILLFYIFKSHNSSYVGNNANIIMNSIHQINRYYIYNDDFGHNTPYILPETPENDTNIEEYQQENSYPIYINDNN